MTKRSNDKKDKIYVVTMYMWGDRDLHSYVVYAGFDRTKAYDTSKEEYEHRGHKYDPEIIEFTPDVPETKKVIKSLK